VPRILVVDDEEGIRETLSLYLEAMGYLVETAPDAAAGLEAIVRGFDLVITDLRMPGLSGLEYLKALRMMEPDLLTVIISGYPSVETIEEARAHGAVAYLRKPLRLEELAAVLRHCLDVRAATP
jgi:DNA-binding NtrC family response regulator